MNDFELLRAHRLQHRSLVMRWFLWAIVLIFVGALLGSLTACVSAPPASVVSAPAAAPSPAPSPTPAVVSSDAAAKIMAIASGSSCATIEFANHGRPRAGWLKGIAVVYARAVCQPDREEVKLISAAPGEDDALALYGLKGNEIAKTYALMVGLAARESEWKLCCGRDMSSDFSKADSAEASFLQTSRGAAYGKGNVPRAGGALLRLIDKWKGADKTACLYDVFAAGASCGSGDARNWGDPSEAGYQWQALSKSCPAFAAEYGAIVMRVHGGSLGEFGPIRTHRAEFHSECEVMFNQVAAAVHDHPEMCAGL